MVEQGAKPRAGAGSSAALVAVLATPALLVWAWGRPAPAAPIEVPPLVLDPALVHGQLALDAERSAQAPRGEEATARRRLYRESNVAEHEGIEPAGRARARATELAAVLEHVREAHGESALGAMRASDAQRLEPALRGELSEDERIAELGGFVRMMERYGLVRGERQVAPRMVVRSLFKARWNALHGLPLTEGLSAIERQAYWGWLALRGEGAPMDRRLDALEQYRRAGGARHREARAVLLYDEGRLEEAREAFDAAHTATPSFRLANHALACAEAQLDAPLPAP